MHAGLQRFSTKILAHERLVFLGILLLAGGLRGLHLWQSSSTPLFEHLRLDSLYYDQAARYILEQDPGLGDQAFHLSPFYTYFLALLYQVFGYSILAVKLVQLGLGLGIVAGARALGRQVAGPMTGLLASGMVALYGPLIFYEAQVLPTAAAAFLTIWAVYLFLLARTRGLMTALAGGLVLGLALIARPNLLPFVPLAGALMLWDRGYGSLRTRALKASLLGAGVFLALAPVTARNLIRGDSFVLITDSAGLNLYIGNHQGAAGYFEPTFGAGSATGLFQAFKTRAEAETGRSLTSREVSGFWTARTLEEIAQDPGAWLGLEVRKAAMLINDYEIPNNWNYQFAKVLTPVLRGPLAGFGCLFPLMLLGLGVFARSPRASHGLLAAIAVSLATLMLFFVTARYRLLVVPLLLVAAARGLVFLGELVDKRPKPWRAGLLAAFLLLGYLAAFFPLDIHDRKFDQDFFQLGYAYHIRNQPSQARAAYEAAISLNPENVSARKNLARILEAGGDRAAAAAQFRQILEAAERTGEESLKATAERELLRLGLPPAPAGPP